MGQDAAGYVLIHDAFIRVFMIDPNSFARQDFFWSAFLVFLFVPLIGSAVSPLPFAAVMPLTGAAFFILHKFVFGTWPWLRAPLKGLLPLTAALFALAALSSLWSVTPAGSLERAGKIAALVVPSFGVLALAQACPFHVWQKYRLLFPFAAFVVGALMASELFFGLPLYGLLNPGLEKIQGDFLNKNVSVFVLVLPVSLYLAWKSRSVLFALALIVLAAMLFALAFTQAAQLALIAFLALSFGCMSFLEKITMRGVFIGLVFIFALMPWIAPTLFDVFAARLDDPKGLMGAASVSLRLENWDFLARRIMENPLTGFGMDTTRAMTFDTEKLYFNSDRILHPHNAALQLWIEFGIFGAAWALAALGFIYALFTRLSPAARRLGFLTFSMVMVFLLVSWSLWASWLIAFILYLAALCVLATKTSNDPSPS